MEKDASWDFRCPDEQDLSSKYDRCGYVIFEGDKTYLEAIKSSVKKSVLRYLGKIENKSPSQDLRLEKIHSIIPAEQSNNIRLHVMNEICKTTSFNRNYYESAKKIIHTLCGNELAMQKRPGISVNFPNNAEDILPIHADTWNGVSPYELNIWIPIVDCKKTMCLYILERHKFQERINSDDKLLRLTSDEMFNELKSDLTWIDINYGDIIAFDQSLPHGYALNKEADTHWSFNCRFKGLHTPYWDKKLGEYFMPITAKCCTRIGMNYRHPEGWL